MQEAGGIGNLCESEVRTRCNEVFGIFQAAVPDELRNGGAGLGEQGANLPVGKPEALHQLLPAVLVDSTFAAAGEASKAGSCCDPYLRLSKALTTKNVTTAVSAQGSMVVRSSKSSGF